MKCLEFEIKWVCKNIDKYESNEHASRVIYNITMRYLKKAKLEEFKKAKVYFNNEIKKIKESSS